MNIRHALTAVVAALGLVCAAAHAPAQSDWEFELTPLYAWFVSGDTDVTAGGISSQSDFEFDDIMDNLDFIFTAHFEAKTTGWGLFADISYAELGKQEGGLQANVDSFIGELGAGINVSGEWQVIFGGRWYDIDITLQNLADPTMTASGGIDWVDPFVGIRGRTQIGTNWWFSGRVDIGGLGLASDFTWNILVSFDYDISDLVQLRLGFRAMDVQYDEGSGAEAYEYDMRFYGPMVGFTFRF